MTRDEILAMKPGRELDALIAEKVMGWKTNWLKTDWWEEINPNTHRHKGLVKDFKPSTDIAAAWEVAEQLTRRKDVQNPMFADFSLVKKWDTYEAVFIPVGKLGGKPSFGCKTAAEAICKAALLAVGVNGE